VIKQNQVKTVLINQNNTNTRHECNPANPHTGAKPSYKKKMKSESTIKIKKDSKLSEWNNRQHGTEPSANNPLNKQQA
jgi:hypothetical protein